MPLGQQVMEDGLDFDVRREIGKHNGEDKNERRHHLATLDAKRRETFDSTNLLHDLILDRWLDWLGPRPAPDSVKPRAE
jgi:hypothetical protein